MATEKDIRKFIKGNAPELTDSDRFMADLTRQIDLLPVPSALAGKDRDVESEIRIVRELARSVKRRHLRAALLAIMVALMTFIPVMSLWLAYPVIWETLSKYGYYIFGAVSALILYGSLLRTSSFRIR
ncbi:MAG: hypothetical protein OSJ55_05380 [Bacteroidales bacterium]|nr:hypothetical protein [Bacteroidales bacterium]